ncbi:MAG: DegV family protein [Anaerolineales bacterium]|nr:DegV family protein [Anaerolineales bacterium]
MEKIAIVTDSTADIPSDLSQELNISVVPNILIIRGKQYLDGQSITREEYYTQLPTLSPPPTTAAPASGMFSKVYQQLFDSGVQKICSIHAASPLSGLFNSASIASEDFRHRVQVIDSGQLSMGLGFQAISAAQAATKGSMELVFDAVRSIQQRVKVIAMLDTLDQLKRSGRVSWVRAGLGSLLKIKLFLEVKDGQVLRLGEARTRTKGIQRLIGMLDELGPLEQIAVLHTNAFQDAARLAEQLAHLVTQPVIIQNVTTVIGTHVGVNALGLAAVRKK